MITNASGTVEWTDKDDLITGVSNTSAGNTLTTTVNGTTGTAVDIINTNVLSLNTDNELVSTVNGVASVALNLKDAVQQEQKTTTLIDGTNTTVQKTVTANNTEWQVNVATAKGADGTNPAILGVVKEAAANPTVLVSQTGELAVNNEVMNGIKVVAVDYNAAANDAIILGNANTSNVTITLPVASPTNKGKKYTIKKEDANEDGYVNVIGTIVGVPSGELYTAVPYTGWDLVSDGTAWRIVNKF